MNPEDAQLDRRAQEIFGRALDLPNPNDRARFVTGACGKDGRLQSRVEALLACDVEDGFLKVHPATLGRQTVWAGTISETPGDVIGRYKLLEKIGEGGCGVVYVAEQTEPVRRRVALKVIKPGMDSR